MKNYDIYFKIIQWFDARLTAGQVHQLVLYYFTNTSLCLDKICFYNTDLAKSTSNNWNAIEYNRLDLCKVEYISIQHGLYSTICHDHVDILKWLHSNNCVVGQNEFSTAALHGSFKCIKWMHSVGIPFCENTFNYAASLGNIGIMKWLKSKNCWYEYSEVRYYCGENIKIIKWVQDNLGT
jgi:hypothetical protein